MRFLKSLQPSIFLLFAHLLTYTHAVTFLIQNSCLYTVWAAAVPGGGQRLDRGQTWTLDVPTGSNGRVWARTGCNFNSSGQGKCQTGDCGGLLDCEGYGAPPCTLAEFSLNQFNNTDFYDLSLVYGFNVPVEFSPVSGGCTRGIKCAADINDQCPNEFRAPGGCNNPCTVFKTNEYCCNSGNCKLTDYAKIFKDGCPDAYAYPRDDNATFTCQGGANYKVVFCPDRTVSYFLVCD